MTVLAGLLVNHRDPYVIIAADTKNVMEDELGRLTEGPRVFKIHQVFPELITGLAGSFPGRLDVVFERLNLFVFQNYTRESELSKVVTGMIDFLRHQLTPHRNTSYGFELIIGGLNNGFPCLCSIDIRADRLYDTQVNYSNRDNQLQVVLCGKAFGINDQDIKEKYREKIRASIHDPAEVTINFTQCISEISERYPQDCNTNIETLMIRSSRL